MKATTARAKWIARATREASNLPHFPFSDSESSRRAADEAKKKKLEAKAMGGEKSKLLPKVAAFARSPALGGHTLEDHAVQRRGGKSTDEKSGPARSITVKAWRCTLCRLTSTKWHSFAPARCPGSAASKWADKAVTAADNAQTTGAGHQRMISGDVVWCRTCGCYADALARGLATACRGKPDGNNSGGRVAQLKLLRAGRHPLTREMLPQAIDEEGGCMAYDRSVKVGAEGLEARRIGRMPTSAEQRAYPNAESSSYAGPSDAAAKMRARLERVRAKQRAAEATAKKLQVPVMSMRRLRGKQTTTQKSPLGEQSTVKSEDERWEDRFRGQVECSVCHSTTF